MSRWSLCGQQPLRASSARNDTETVVHDISLQSREACSRHARVSGHYGAKADPAVVVTHSARQTAFHTSKDVLNAPKLPAEVQYVSRRMEF